MRFYYGEQNLLRALDETEFWKHQEAEHAGLIPAVTPNLEREYAGRLEKFGTDFRLMMAEAARYIESAVRSKGMVSKEMRAAMLEFVRRCIEQSADFVNLLTEMLNNSQAVRQNPTSTEVIHHMIRESQYYVGIGQLILS